MNCIIYDKLTHVSDFCSRTKLKSIRHPDQQRHSLAIASLRECQCYEKPASAMQLPRMVLDIASKIADMEKVYKDLQANQDSTYDTVPDRCMPQLLEF